MMTRGEMWALKRRLALAHRVDWQFVSLSLVIRETIHARQATPSQRAFMSSYRKVRMVRERMTHTCRMEQFIENFPIHSLIWARHARRLKTWNDSIIFSLFAPLYASPTICVTHNSGDTTAAISRRNTSSDSSSTFHYILCISLSSFVLSKRWVCAAVGNFLACIDADRSYTENFYFIN